MAYQFTVSRQAGRRISIETKVATHTLTVPAAIALGSAISDLYSRQGQSRFDRPTEQVQYDGVVPYYSEVQGCTVFSFCIEARGYVVDAHSANELAKALISASRKT